MSATAYCIDAEGWLVSALHFDDEAARDVELAARPDLVSGIAPPETTAAGLRPRRVGAAWMALPWPPAPTTAQRRAALLDRAKAERDRRVDGGFTWDGSRFDSDTAISQPRLLGLFVAAGTPLFPADGQPWRLSDNSWRVLSALDAQSVFAALQFHLASHFAAFAAIEAQILAAADDAALSSIDLTQGWPAP